MNIEEERANAMRPARERLVEHYKKEGLVPLSARDELLLIAAARCVGCGLCTLVCPVLAAEPRYCGPRTVAMTAARLPAAAPAARNVIFYCTTCGACEVACPRKVPVPETVAFLRLMLARLAEDEEYHPERLREVRRRVRARGSPYE